MKKICGHPKHKGSKYATVSVTVKDLKGNVKYYICEDCCGKSMKVSKKPPLTRTTKVQEWVSGAVSSFNRVNKLNGKVIKLREVACLACGRVFTQSTPHHKYCSKLCQRRTAREKRNIENLTKQFADDSL